VYARHQMYAFAFALICTSLRVAQLIINGEESASYRRRVITSPLAHDAKRANIVNDTKRIIKLTHQGTAPNRGRRLIFTTALFYFELLTLPSQYAEQGLWIV